MSSNIARGFNSARSNARAGFNRGMQSAKQNSAEILKWFLIIVVAILLIVLVVKLIEWASGKKKGQTVNTPVLISGTVSANSDALAKKEYKVPHNTTGMGYSYSLWVYVADWNYNFGNQKNVLIRGSGSVVSPEISFDSDVNNLLIKQTLLNGKPATCDIANFPLQKWVNLIVVLSNRTLDTYVNGKLERSCVLTNVPRIANGAPVRFAQALGGSTLNGFFGKLSNCQYFNYAIQQDQILKLYNAGPYEATDYNIVFFKNGKFVQFKDANASEEKDHVY